MPLTKRTNLESRNESLSAEIALLKNMQIESAKQLTSAHSREMSYKRIIAQMEKEHAPTNVHMSSIPKKVEDAILRVDPTVTVPVQSTVETPPEPRINVLSASRVPAKMKEAKVAAKATTLFANSEAQQTTTTTKDNIAATTGSTLNTKKKPKRKVKIISQESNIDMDTSEEIPETTNDVSSAISGRKSKFVPMIITLNVNIKSVTNDIRELLGHNNFSINIVSGKKANFQLQSAEDHQRVRALFVEKGVEFFTFSPKHETPHSIVMERLSSTYDKVDIEAALANLDMKLEVKNVVKLGFEKWLIFLGKGSEINKFYKIRWFLNCRIRLKKDKKKTLPQCRNCQAHGHVSNNCGRPYKCVKCAGPHGPGNCHIPKGVHKPKMVMVTDPLTGETRMEPEFVFKCANCNKEGHPANSKQCPIKKALLAKLNNAKVEKAETPKKNSFPLNSGKVKPGVTYASSSKQNANIGNIQHTTVNTNQGPMCEAMDSFEKFNEICTKNFGKDFFTCLNKVRRYAKDINSLNEDSQAKAMVGILTSLGFDD